MWVHLRKKVMRFTHNKKRITIQGVQNKAPKCKRVTVSKLKGLLKRDKVEQMLLVQTPDADMLVAVADDEAATIPVESSPEIQAILQEYAHLFKEPTDLPPARSQDHTIPLIPGAQPFKIRPYRYSPQ